MLQIHEQVRQVPEGPVDLQISFVTASSPPNWTELWKPTIDSLEALLGRDPAAGRNLYQPQDDRIVSLQLHHAVEEGLGKTVRLAIWWRQAEGSAQ